MASRKSFVAKPSYVYPASAAMIGESEVVHSSDALFEFDESEVWSDASSAAAAKGGGGQGLIEARKWIPAGGRSSSSSAAAARKKMSSSVPVNVPDWSKILKEDYKDHRKVRDGGDEGEDFDDGGDGFGGLGGGDRIPPHEYLARTRGASLSVHEGVGRTLKGRDLRRVRNAIWKKVGFED